jgi:hypothetical protein
MTIDLDALISTKINEKLDTNFPVPPEKEYIARIGTPREHIKEWFRSVKRDDGTQTATLNIPFVLQDEDVRRQMGVRQLTSRLTIWLDTEISGALATGKGKNVSLGQLLEALGQNGDTNWDFEKLINAGPVKVITSNSTGKDGKQYSNVTKVAKL